MKNIKNILSYLKYWVCQALTWLKPLKSKTIVMNGKEIPLLWYKGKWMLPEITTYSHGLGNPIAMLLHIFEDGYFEPYCDITKNIPDGGRSVGCQFIDTNNNDDDILDWLERNKFGIRTGKVIERGFSCKYPEFNFYKGKNFHRYKKLTEEFYSLSNEE